MTDLHSALGKYLSMRKGFGYKYEHQTRRLGDFVAFMEKRKAKTITIIRSSRWNGRRCRLIGMRPGRCG